MDKPSESAPKEIIQLIYTSSANVSFTGQQLAQLLAHARMHNHSLGISGMLVYDDGFFIQVLEGPQDAVDALYQTIGKDRRHGQIRLLLRTQIQSKEFRQWSMGFADTSILPQNLVGFVPYKTLQQTITDTSRAKKLVQMFQDGRWRLNLPNRTSIGSPPR